MNLVLRKFDGRTACNWMGDNKISVGRHIRAGYDNNCHTIHHADRDVVRITRAMRKGARNTAQMLGNIPGIDCDYSNNELTYYGSKNILILVDSIEKSPEYIKELHHLR